MWKFWYSKHINTPLLPQNANILLAFTSEEGGYWGVGGGRSNHNIICRPKYRLQLTQEGPEEVKIKFSTGWPHLPKTHRSPYGSTTLLTDLTEVRPFCILGQQPAEGWYGLAHVHGGGGSEQEKSFPPDLRKSETHALRTARGAWAGLQ